MSQRKKEKPPKNPSRDPVFDAANVASAAECTGLLPAQIQTPQEGEALSALEAIHPIRTDGEGDGEERREERGK